MNDSVDVTLKPVHLVLFSKLRRHKKNWQNKPSLHNFIDMHISAFPWTYYNQYALIVYVFASRLNYKSPMNIITQSWLEQHRKTLKDLSYFISYIKQKRCKTRARITNKIGKENSRNTSKKHYVGSRLREVAGNKVCKDTSWLQEFQGVFKWNLNSRKKNEFYNQSFKVYLKIATLQKRMLYHIFSEEWIQKI